MTQFLVVSDQDRSREYYRQVLGGKVALERDPVIIKVANTWLIRRPDRRQADGYPFNAIRSDHTSAFLNIRVADTAKVYREWSARGAQFLTEARDHGSPIRAYIRAPDGHLIEVGQSRRVVGGY